MITCKSVGTPMYTNAKLYESADRKLEVATMYKKTVGSLIYSTLRKLDIAFVVGGLRRYIQNPRKPHLDG